MKQISPSQLRMYETCPKQYKYAYIDQIPGLDTEYFQLGRDTEASLYRMLNKELVQVLSEADTLAKAIFENKKFQDLVSGKKLIFQNHLQDGENHGYSDIETDTDIIDIKTSSVKWGKEEVMKSRFQAMIYGKIGRKPFHFVVVNKKTYEVQVIDINVSKFDELREKNNELRTAIDLDSFPATPTYINCQFCSYNSICDKK